MAGTREGGIKSSKAILAKNPNHFSDMGRKGGSMPHPNKGYGADRERAKRDSLKSHIVQGDNVTRGADA